MRQCSFKCHYCDQQITGQHQFTLAFQAGFIWNPKRFDQPAWYFDFCRECEKTFVRKYMEGQSERKAQIEADLLKTWKKRFGLDSTFLDRRKIKTEVPFARRSGDQIKLFNPERSIPQCQNHQRLSGAPLRRLVHPVVTQRHKAKVNARSAALKAA